MINSKELLKMLEGLLAKKEEDPFSWIFGHGIITEQQIDFDKELLEKSKSKIANILKELGIDENSCTSLENLTKLKNGETWNELQTKEDFEALELLLACSDACGFILNDSITSQSNNLRIGDASSLLTSQFGRRSIDGINDEWLHTIRDEISKKMYFPTDINRINKYANSLETSSVRPTIKIK